MALPGGTRLGPYEIVDAIGAGGMGEVYRARDPRLGRDVAIKVLSRRIAADEGLERFEREARATAVLNHRNILTVHDIGREDEMPFVVYELLDGETLRAALTDGPLELPRALGLALQLVRGIASAHALRIVHRDLKPENLFLTTDGTLKILDFGLAKLEALPAVRSDATTLGATEPGRMLGTLDYMAPEQVRGEPVDERADLFAVGAVLYEMITGRPPFRRPSGADTLAAILREDPPSLVAPGIPDELDRLVHRCLEKEAGRRFPSARDLELALESIAASQGSASPAPRPALPTPGSSIAVLPFADLSAGQDQGYLCLGIAEELLNGLSRVQGLRVAARSSSFQFRDPGVDVRAVGRRLGVDHVLEGSVRKAESRLRVSVQLVDVGKGYRVWADRYDREFEDIFEIQDEIAAAVVRSLLGMLVRDADVPLHVADETSIEAYELYLRARQQMHDFRKPALTDAVRMLERALEIDGDYAPAWAGLANANAWLYQWMGGGEKNLEAAHRASRRALELAPDSPDARAARGFALSLVERYDDAAAEFEAALRLDPNGFDACYLYARSEFSRGNVERSVDLFRRAAEVREEDSQALLLLSQSLAMLGRGEESRSAGREGIRRAERQLELDPTDARTLSLAAGTLYDLGDEARARSWIEKAVHLYPEEAGVLINAGCVFAKMGDKERALDTLEKAFARGQGKRDWIEQDPDYDSLRDDPRFQALLEKLP